MPPRVQVKAKRSAATPSVNVDDIIAKVSTAHRDDPIDSIMKRKSRRNPALSYLEKPELRKLLSKILCDDKQTVVLKIKNEMPADVSSIQFDAILAALTHNSVCQALYIQNLSAAIRESQLLALIELLKKKSLIWCVNVGETYDIPLAIWQKFCDALPQTAVTHLYVSEHVIPIQLKNDMRRHIRVNRTKHRLHCSRRNLSVIERCTNMWWNPINGVKLPPVKKLCSNPKDVAYWQQGVGEGGSTAWKFHCVPCGERCSSYEHWRYHPTGRMFECSQCHIWSHVNCTLSGRHYTDEDLEELVDVMCCTCTSKQRRDAGRRFRGDSSSSSRAEGDGAASALKRRRVAEEGEGEEDGDADVSDDDAGFVDDESEPEDATESAPALRFYVNNGKEELLKPHEGVSQLETDAGTKAVRGSTKKRTAGIKKVEKRAKERKVAQDSGEADEDDVPDKYCVEQEVEVTGPWKFKCTCGETCSSEDNPPRYTDGNTFQCSVCDVWSHVACVLGPEVTADELELMMDVKCGWCRRKTKTRVKRTRKSKQQPPPPEQHEQEREGKDEEKLKKMEAKRSEEQSQQLSQWVTASASTFGIGLTRSDDFEEDFDYFSSSAPASVPASVSTAAAVVAAPPAAPANCTSPGDNGPITPPAESNTSIGSSAVTRESFAGKDEKGKDPQARIVLSTENAQPLQRINAAVQSI